MAAELSAMKPGSSVSDFLVRTLLHEMGYSLQANRKTLEGRTIRIRMPNSSISTRPFRTTSSVVNR